MSFLTLGVVSNAWSALLPGSSLEGQCRRAVDAGFQYVELRLRALGDGEERVSGDDRPWPLPDRLAALHEALPELRFNLAVEAPFLTSRLSIREAYLQRCVEAAFALGPPSVLRLVDLSPAPSLRSSEEIETLAPGIVELAAVLAPAGGRLALENSRQPVGVLRAAVARAAKDLPTRVPMPQLCWDPHNQIAQKLQPEDPLETARTLSPEELFEFHFKQSRGGVLQSDVADGEIDWRAVLAALRDRGVRCPALFEIPAGDDAWERLDRSAAYIRQLLAEIEGNPQ